MSAKGDGVLNLRHVLDTLVVTANCTKDEPC